MNFCNAPQPMSGQWPSGGVMTCVLVHVWNNKNMRLISTVLDSIDWFQDSVCERSFWWTVSKLMPKFHIGLLIKSQDQAQAQILWATEKKRPQNSSCSQFNDWNFAFLVFWHMGYIGAFLTSVAVLKNNFFKLVVEKILIDLRSFGHVEGIFWRDTFHKF